MFDLTTLLISSAQAADAVVAPAAAVAAPGEAGGGLMRFLPIFLIFIVFYFLMIRPQQKKLDEQTNMLKAIKKGDKIITAAGFVGTVVKLEGDDYLLVEIAKDVTVKVVRSTVAGLFDEKKVAANTDQKA